MSGQQKQLFNTRIVPGRKGSGRLFEEQLVAPDSPMECLGMTFKNDEARFLFKVHSLEEIAAKIERFEDIGAWQKARELIGQIYDTSNGKNLAADVYPACPMKSEGHFIGIKYREAVRRRRISLGNADGEKRIKGQGKG